MADLFKFELVAPERLLISEEVEQVIVPGAEGEFTMLAHHAPLLATLKPGLLDIFQSGGGHRRFFLRGGFAEVGPSGLTVLAATAIELADLKGDTLAESIKDAEDDLAEASDDDARDRARTKLDHLRQVQATLSQ